jgi:hypothetical protein
MPAHCVALTIKPARHQKEPLSITAPFAEAGTMTDSRIMTITDEAIVAIARPLAIAFAKWAHSRDPNDRREVFRIATELCTVIDREDPTCQLRSQVSDALEAMRERLPNRRKSETFDFESMGMQFTASFSRYSDARIAELFIDNHKAGSSVGTLVRDLAIAFSFAVQHGASAEAIRQALCRDEKGQPLGPLGAALDLLNKEDHE